MHYDAIGFVDGNVSKDVVQMRVSEVQLSILPRKRCNDNFFHRAKLTVNDADGGSFLTGEPKHVPSHTYAIGHTVVGQKAIL